jgi:hypothetical protein
MVENETDATAAGNTTPAQGADASVELTDAEGTKYNLNKADFEEYIARGPKWQDALRKKGEKLNQEHIQSKKDDENRFNAWRKEIMAKTSQKQNKEFDNETKIAKLTMKQEYEDFDDKEIEKHYNTFDPESQNDRWHYAYLAWLGSQKENLVEEARADVAREMKARGGRGLPQPGPPGKMEPGEPKNDEEAREASLWTLKNILRK